MALSSIWKKGGGGDIPHMRQDNVFSKSTFHLWVKTGNAYGESLIVVRDFKVMTTRKPN